MRGTFLQRGKCYRFFDFERMRIFIFTDTGARSNLLRDTLARILKMFASI